MNGVHVGYGLLCDLPQPKQAKAHSACLVRATEMGAHRRGSSSKQPGGQNGIRAPTICRLVQSVYNRSPLRPTAHHSHPLWAQTYRVLGVSRRLRYSVESSSFTATFVPSFLINIATSIAQTSWLRSTSEHSHSAQGVHRLGENAESGGRDVAVAVRHSCGVEGNSVVPGVKLSGCFCSPKRIRYPRSSRPHLRVVARIYPTRPRSTC